MAYTPYNPDLPDGSIQNGPQVIQSIQDNGYSLWTSLAVGMLPGFSLTCSGGTAAEPTSFIFAEDGSPAEQRVRGVVTWSGGRISSIVWAVSQNGGGAYTTKGTSTFSYDGSGNLTGCSGVSGFVAFLAGMIGKLTDARTRLATAEATLAGLGSMSLQAASAVAVTGGTVKGVVLGGTGASEAQLAYLIPREPWVDLGGGSPANTFTIDFNAGGAFRMAPGNNFTIAVTNQPPNGFAQRVVLEIIGAAGYTVTLPSGYSWGGAGAPTFTAGPDLVTVYCRSHATTPVKRFMLSSYGA